MLIKRINISNFGSFSGFNWSNSIKDDQAVKDFKRLNILYGRNYSGKTTLSRIFRSFEVGKFPEYFKKPSFEIIADVGTLTQDSIASHTLDIRVYNRDFIDENLSFLKDSVEGEIKTFAIIGSENKEIEKQIEEKENKLGNVESETGLRFVLFKLNKEYLRKKKKAKESEDELREKLRRQANDVIKPNRTYGYPSYNIVGIMDDIETIRKEKFTVLDEEKKREKYDLLKEEVHPDIDKKVSCEPVFSKLYESSRIILEKEIKPSEPIQELLNDALLQSWVKTGMTIHRDNRSTCGFCRQPLPDDIWNKLDAHFDKQSSELEEELKLQINAIDSELRAINSIVLPEKEEFYSSNQFKFESTKKLFDKAKNSYELEIEKLSSWLKNRQRDIFKTISCEDLEDYSQDLIDQCAAINSLIEVNNKEAELLPQQQKKARIELRFNAVARYIDNINYDAENVKIDKLKTEVDSSEKEVNSLKEEIGEIEREIDTLRIKLQDEKKGAEKVNQYLNHFFGHEGLKLVAVEDALESKYKFQIMRGEEPAYNMSEGECSLVSFCYFIARLEDIETKGKELIVYIDDPISSLDSNHIYFVYSLIESVLAKPDKSPEGVKTYKYSQLFLSTHNLDFFKYLKRLSMPNNSDGGTEFFLVEKENNVSRLSLMPKYLKDYQTEFHYLFHQIYKCKDGQHAKENYEVFYNFGNNLRKFLEAYLFYKYPYKDNQNKPSERLHKFFGEDVTSTALTNRVSNELSHLEEIFDRSMRPVEIPEIPAVAQFVLDKMYEKDKDQYNALLKSIGEPTREDA